MSSARRAVHEGQMPRTPGSSESNRCLRRLPAMRPPLVVASAVLAAAAAVAAVIASLTAMNPQGPGAALTAVTPCPPLVAVGKASTRELAPEAMAGRAADRLARGRAFGALRTALRALPLQDGRTVADLNIDDDALQASVRLADTRVFGGAGTFTGLDQLQGDAEIEVEFDMSCDAIGVLVAPAQVRR